MRCIIIAFKINDQITITKVDKVKKNLYFKVSYADVVSFTAKKNKEVFANAYMFKLNDYFTLNFQIYGQIVDIVKAVEEDVKGIDL